MDLERIEYIKGKGALPKHVAVIMDGNGRWAQRRGLTRIEGHKEGINSVRAVVETAGALGIEVLTLYTFSSENWSRPKQEVSALMSLLLTTVRDEVDELNKKNVRLMTIGDLNLMPAAPRLGVINTIKRLQNNTGLLLNLALSYSGRQEIVQAVKKIAMDVKKGVLADSDINEELIGKYLETRMIGDPDLLIRTSGEMRLSNFLLWQLAYTELYITDILWPDFRDADFMNAIEAYQKRERRFGKVSEQI
ncbi:MAG TPA: isoprenyl transferase [bacterium]|nr:isoprenyl transferase [bacterium]HPN42274.1 isoprenyl transferase [bacterium]